MISYICLHSMICFLVFYPRKWQPNEEQRLEDATVNKAVAKYGAQKGWKEGW